MPKCSKNTVYKTTIDWCYNLVSFVEKLNKVNRLNILTMLAFTHFIKTEHC
jgi:hypothetical protein